VKNQTWTAAAIAFLAAALAGAAALVLSRGGTDEAISFFSAMEPGGGMSGLFADGERPDGPLLTRERIKPKASHDEEREDGMGCAPPAPSVTDDRGGSTLNGRVLDGSTRAPLADARVVYFDPFHGTKSETLTDADGRFVLPGLPAISRLDMSWLRWGLDAFYSLERASETGFVQDGPDSCTIELYLERGGTVAGRVLDSRGAPARRARILAYDLLLRSEGSRSARRDFGRSILCAGIETFEECTVFTDELGCYCIPSVPPGALIRIAALVPGHSLALGDSLVLAPGERRDNVDLLAKKGAGITGTVLDGDGSPVGKARVDVFEHGAGSFLGLLRPSGNEPRFLADTRTDEKGGFTFDGLAAGEYTLRAYKQDRGEAVVEKTELEKGESFECLLRLDDDASAAAGTVQDGRGRPVPGIVVEFLPHPLPEGMTMIPVCARSDEGGRFRTAGLWRGVRHTVSAADPEGRHAIPGKGSLPDFILPGTEDLVIRAFLAASVSGRVENLPEGAAPSVLVRHEDSGAQGEKRTRSAGSGRFRITGLIPGNYSVVVRGKGLTEKRVGGFIAAEGENIEDLVFCYGGTTTITGRVLDPAVSAAGGGRKVWLLDPIRRAASTPRNPSAGIVAETLTSSSGRYRFTGVQPGSYDVVCWDLEVGCGSLRNVIVVEGEELSCPDLEISRGAGIIGQALKKDGTIPDRSLRILFVNPDHLSRLISTDGAGRFRIRLVPGEYFWTFVTPGTVPDVHTLHIPHDRADLSIVLR
jgi:protocatechuate 3,4-dioxygenase beta subunit